MRPTQIIRPKHTHRFSTKRKIRLSKKNRKFIACKTVKISTRLILMSERLDLERKTPIW